MFAYHSCTSAVVLHPNLQCLAVSVFDYVLIGDVQLDSQRRGAGSYAADPDSRCVSVLVPILCFVVAIVFLVCVRTDGFE